MAMNWGRGVLSGIVLTLGLSQAAGAIPSVLANEQIPKEQIPNEQIQGQMISFPPKTACVTAEPDSLCFFNVEGIALSQDGEVIYRVTEGTSGDDLAALADTTQSLSDTRWFFADGSSLRLRSESVSQQAEDGSRGVSGTQNCIGGTGRFLNADCVIEWSMSRQDNGLFVGSFKGEIQPQG